MGSAALLARRSAFGFTTVFLERGLALATVVVLGRILAPDVFGLYALVVAYLGLFQVLGDFGLEALLVQRLAQAPAQRGRVLGAALALRLTLALGAGGLAVALAPLAGVTGADGRAIVATGAIALLLIGQPVFRAFLRAELRLGQVLAVAVGTSALALALVATAAAAGAGLVTIFLAAALAQATGLVAAALLVRSRIALEPRFDLARWRDLLRQAWPIGANVLVVTIGLRAGALVLMSARGATEVGYFASASRLAEAMNLIAEGALMSAAPLLARFAGDRRRFVALSELVAKGLAIAFLTVILVVWELAADLLGALFQPAFAVAAPALVVLSCAALLSGLGTLYASLLIAVGRQSVLFRLNAVAAAVQIVMQLVLVPRFGLLGAATAALATSVATHLTLAFLPATRALVRPCVAAAARPTAIAVALLALAHLLPLAPAARAAVLVATFLATVLVTRIVGRSDIALVRTLARPDALSRP